MIFYIELEQSGGGWHAWPTNIYGGFDTRLQARDHFTKRHPGDHKLRMLLFEGEILGVIKDPKEKPESEKRKPDPKNWTQKADPTGNGDITWTCNDCGAVIQGVSVAHPIHDGPFPLSGSGECQYSTEGYCPNCDKKPSFHGDPITVPWPG